MLRDFAPSPALSMNPASTPARGPSWLSWLLLLLGTTGFAAIWVVLAWSNDRQCSWMALLGALDIAWILRLGAWRPGQQRMVIGIIATAVIVLLANWWIIAAQLGAVLGFEPWDSALRLGVHHAWTLAQLANGPLDMLWIVAGLVLAALASR